MGRSALFWFRRDLRLADNTGLQHALATADRVHAAFVFDTTILDELPRTDRRVDFIHRTVQGLHAALADVGGGLHVAHGDPLREIPALARALQVDVVVCNEDYEPAAVRRDDAVREALSRDGIAFETLKDATVFARDEVLTQQGKPYTVFTPYRRTWFERLKAHPVGEATALAEPPLQALGERVVRDAAQGVPALAKLGFATSDLDELRIMPGAAGAEALLTRFLDEGIAHYDADRDLPGKDNTSRLSLYNRFGCISPRRLVAIAQEQAQANPAQREACTIWISEIAWRDFFFQILHHYPHAAQGPFKREYESLGWENDEALFAAWCEGRTGYPIVDAAMRQLVETGFMHNRLRMVTASFLTKDLLIDWQRGEAFFARHLMDYEMAANNGNWQWAASTGCDPQPYFRVFNPSRQSERFDADATFIHRHVPELRSVPADLLHEPWKHAAKIARHGVVLGRDYPERVVEHSERARRAVRMYEIARDAAKA